MEIGQPTLKGDGGNPFSSTDTGFRALSSYLYKVKDFNYEVRYNVSNGYEIRLHNANTILGNNTTTYTETHLIYFHNLKIHLNNLKLKKG